MNRDKRPLEDRVPPDPRRIRWSPTVRPLMLERLYASDADGMRDEELCLDVGFRLYARCETFVMVERGEVECPVCRVVFEVEGARVGSPQSEAVTSCPGDGCDWRTNATTWWQSVRNYYAWPGRAGSAFAGFFSAWPRARSYGERMVAIDQLIHAYHLNALGGPGKSVASKLLEGNKNAVVACLDRLSARDSGAEAVWREHVFGGSS